MRRINAGEDRKALLFLKNQIDTNYSRKILEKINVDYRLPCIIDDPFESPIQSFSWYLEQLSNVPAILVEFSSTEREGYLTQNAKCAVICGLAYGLGRKLLMVAEEPYLTPVDYRELLVRYNNYTSLERSIADYLSVVKEDALEFLSRRLLSKRQQRDRTNLQNIDFGEYRAENEADEVSSYYLDVLDLNSIVRNESNIVIGRKGVGKTATFYALREFLEQDSKNHVCVIEPEAFEVEGLLNSIQSQQDTYEKNYLLESIWKFTIYAQIAVSIYEKIQKRHPSSFSNFENDFSKFIEQNSKVFLSDLSTRLETELATLLLDHLEQNGDTLSFKSRVAEKLHDNTIAKVREKLPQVFDKNRIVVLIDNLDKGWNEGFNAHNIRVHNQWILGLLRVSSSIVKDLSKISQQKLDQRDRRQRIDFNLTVFLRSDIFKYIRDYCSEPDKLNYIPLKWDDQETLFRVIEKRFVELNSKVVQPEDLWKSYIIDSIDGEPIKNYIFDRIIPRPRDLIIFFRDAKSTALGRGHEFIDKSDIESAYSQYSDWFFTSIPAESDASVRGIKNFLNKLKGGKSIIDKKTVVSHMRRAGLLNNSLDADSDEVDYFIDYLTSISILGREVDTNVFEFEYDFENHDTIKILAEKLGTERFKIHNALVSTLRCSEVQQESRRIEQNMG